jgi:hypothetical protein
MKRNALIFLMNFLGMQAVVAEYVRALLINLSPYEFSSLSGKFGSKKKFLERNFFLI